MLQLEAEVVRVEGRGASDILHLISNAVHTDDLRGASLQSRPWTILSRSSHAPLLLFGWSQC